MEDPETRELRLDQEARERDEREQAHEADLPREERTADMQNTFHNYAKVVEVRAERELEAVLFWFQNFAIVPVGIFVGFIVAALYSPMFELAGRIGK